MIKRKNLLFIMILVILLGVIPNILKISGLGVKVGTLISYEPGDGDPPVIDGNLIESEWLSTDSLEIRLYLFSSESTTLNITIYSLNTADILYLGAVIPNASQDISSFMVIFKTNSSEELFYFPSGELEFGDGHDAKFYCFSSDEINDCYTTSSGDIINDDVAIGGTNDTLCKSTHDATHCFVEMAIPFDSGDTIGCDLETTNSAAVVIWFYVEFAGGAEFIQANEPQETFEYCELIITPLVIDFTPTASIPFFIAITSIASLCVTIFYIRKRVVK